MYEGRSINKFQNSIILLIFKTFNVKIVKCTFCRKFNSEYQLTSFMNIRWQHCCWKHPERNSIVTRFRFWWATELSASAIQFKMCPVYGDRRCTRPVGLVAWYSGKTLVFDRWTFSVLLSTCSRRVTTYVGKPSAVGQPTRPTQPFILSGYINE